jgi:hypothetical protein
VPRGQRDGFLRPYSQPSRLQPLLFLLGPVPYPVLLRKSGSAGNRTRASGSVARNSER